MNNKSPYSEPINIVNKDWAELSPSHFLIPRHYSDCVDHVMISHGMVQDRLQRLASDFYYSISDRSKPILALCVLKGASQFFNDFVTQLKNLAARDTERPPQILVDFIRLKSYVNSESTGKVQIIGMSSLQDLTGKHVLVVEDIIDTGRTMKKLLNAIDEYKPATCTVCSLLLKDTKNALPDRPEPQLCGFIIPDKFLVGYCLDYNENFRDLDHICTISETGFKRYQEKQGE